MFEPQGLRFSKSDFVQYLEIINSSNIRIWSPMWNLCTVKTEKLWYKFKITLKLISKHCIHLSISIFSVLSLSLVQKDAEKRESNDNTRITLSSWTASVVQDLEPGISLWSDRSMVPWGRDSVVYVVGKAGESGKGWCSRVWPFWCIHVALQAQEEENTYIKKK